MHYLHALDYLAYAYLQRGEDRKAHDVLQMIDALEGPFHVHLATPYTLAAVPARVALERQNWESAAALEARKPSSYPWDNIPAIEAITHFARALGAARSGDTEAAAASIEILSSLHEKAAETSPYWARQIEVQHLSASAWLEYERGAREKALDTMRKAAEVEASTEKHPVTPGEVLPAYELLGDMLLEMGRFDEARTAYETALARSPNRLNSLHGAGRAAELGGRPDVAAGYFSRLAQMTSSADTDSERIRHARAYLSSD